MAQEVKFTQMVRCGCGIDVHQERITATVRRSDQDFETREFDTFTSSLTELREWCKAEGVTHIAMESTGIYWKPLFNVLEEDFEIILVNARHVKNVPGHKTDNKDSRWLSKLLLSGLLKGSFNHRFMMRIMKQRIKDTEGLIEEMDREIDKAAEQYKDEVELLETIPGVGKNSAINIISEIGVDMSKFPNEQHLSSWAGMSPGSNKSAGKKSTRTTHGNKYLRTILVECGWGATRKKDSYQKRK